MGMNRLAGNYKSHTTRRKIVTPIERAVVLVSHKYLDVKTTEIADMLEERGFAYSPGARRLVVEQRYTADAVNLFF